MRLVIELPPPGPPRPGTASRISSANVLVLGKDRVMKLNTAGATRRTGPKKTDWDLMASSFGGSAFDLKLSDRTVPLANIMALMLYCCGALLSAFLTLALMHTGAKIVSLTAGDRSAVKQLLQSAFGSSLQPKAAADDQERKKRD